MEFRRLNEQKERLISDITELEGIVERSRGDTVVPSTLEAGGYYGVFV